MKRSKFLENCVFSAKAETARSVTSCAEAGTLAVIAAKSIQMPERPTSIAPSPGWSYRCLIERALQSIQMNMIAPRLDGVKPMSRRDIQAAPPMRDTTGLVPTPS
jgi:hypothetical protein